MSFAIPHPFRNLIDNRYSYIQRMLMEYPAYLQKLEDEKVEEANRIANDNCDLDDNIRITIYGSMVAGLEVFEEVSDYFYQAMAIIIMSYFDCLIEKMALTEGIEKGGGIDKKVKDLCRKIGFSSSSAIWDRLEYIKKFRKLRNDLDHNNAGTHNNMLIVREIASYEEDVHINCDGNISITGPDYLHKVLKQEYYVLSEIATSMGYNTFTLYYLEGIYQDPLKITYCHQKDEFFFDSDLSLGSNHSFLRTITCKDETLFFSICEDGRTSIKEVYCPLDTMESKLNSIKDTILALRQEYSTEGLFSGESFSEFSSRMVDLIANKPLKHPNVQLNAWRRIHAWLSDNRSIYLPSNHLHLPIDKTTFKSAFHAAHPTPSGHLSGADDTVINLMYRVLGKPPSKYK